MTVDYLGVARGIGARLADTAIWHEGRCNWLGVRVFGNGQAGFRETVAALGGDLYSGSSGVALFLAELHAVAGGDAFAGTAMGAIEHALGRADSAEDIGPGLYDGRLGIALAAARIGMLVRDSQLLERAADVADRAHRLASELGFDLLSGRAGGIVALLILAKLLDDDGLMEHATKLGDELIATVTEDGRYHPRSDVRARRPLTGLSHGAAGVGYALGELFHNTGDARYLHAAEAAFAYERAHFDPETRNWPDFRHDTGRRRGQVPPVFTTQWCHGAPGIGLTRLRAYRLRDDDSCLTEAVAAMATTRDAVAVSLAKPGANYSLCHGLSGNAEVLLYAEESLGSEGAEHRALAIRVAEHGIERFAAPNRMWPCGTREGVTPNLMLGLAGIGHFYLRLHDSTVPSVLLMRPESFVGRAVIDGRVGEDPQPGWQRGDPEQSASVTLR